MAPVTVSVAGIARQIIDDPKLTNLLERLSEFDKSPLQIALDNEESLSEENHVDIKGLVKELEKWPKWRFQEQADLYEWKRPLDAIDAALRYLVKSNPSILLIGQRPKNNSTVIQAESIAEVTNIPSEVTHSVKVILRFLCQLLKNASSKSVFNSVEELSDLMAAADDEIASLALETLANLSCPTMIHKQQAPEIHQHTTALHTASSETGIHSRLMALARGWGSKGSGLGLTSCVIADDSLSGQGSLPNHAGELNFEYFWTPVDTEEARKEEGSTNMVVDAKSSRLIKIHLSAEDIVESLDRQAGKRQRTCSPEPKVKRNQRTFTVKKVKSTVELFFLCLEKAGGRLQLPRSKLFQLLVEIRLAKAFHSSTGRVSAIERRLRALTCILHSHPSQDIMAGYFHAQPELCVELIDLVKPTVSPASITSMTSRSETSTFSKNKDYSSPITAVAESETIPYSIRTLAIEALTALVTRRDGTNGGLTNVARQANVLGELGVGKGQFLGLLPTLIRYSLASLNAFLSQGSVSKEKNEKDEKDGKADNNSNKMDIDDDEALGLDLGLAFLEATKSTPCARIEQEERALEFIDAVLTLTSQVVSVPSGTAALTDCGLIPALVSTVALDSHAAKIRSELNKSPFAPVENIDNGDSYSDCLLKFVTAQAIQILEGACVTHNNALSAFHDLHGVDLLVTRLFVEIEFIRKLSGRKPFEGNVGDSNVYETDFALKNQKNAPQSSDVEMSDGTNQNLNNLPLQGARRVLLFSIVNCLTVVFHQQESSTVPASNPGGGVHLRKPELTHCLMEIMNNVSSYGGVMAALTATLLSDVMNADPQVVHHVHKSGLGKCFLQMISSTRSDVDNNHSLENWIEPNIPNSTEFIMAIPNVLSALALTVDGAKQVREANPFPSLLAIFCSRKYSMPQTRCLLNEMGAIIGTGLDEMMRHVPSLKPLIMDALVKTMKRVIFLGNQLLKEEADFDEKRDDKKNSSDLELLRNLEYSRTCLMQYTYNMGQLLDIILHNEDHCAPFVDVGGVDLLLEMYPMLMPCGKQLLTHMSCLSTPTVASFTHSTTASAFHVAIKSIANHHSPDLVIKKLLSSIDIALEEMKLSQSNLRLATSISFKSEHKDDFGGKISRKYSDMVGVLEGIPRVPLHHLETNSFNSKMIINLSDFLRRVVTIEWLMNILSAVIRVASQKTGETGAGWRKEISSKCFEGVFEKLSLFYQSSIYEVCRIRTEPDFEVRDLEYRKAADGSNKSYHPATYKLRVVCAEGAVVRDGIEIDSCQSVGGLEFGEIVEAFDRCINSSGVMRYRTQRGWVSEQTRGHGREPIAEVLSIDGIAKKSHSNQKQFSGKSNRAECGVPDLCNVSASVLARLQNSQASLCSCLSRVVVLAMRSLPNMRSLPQDNSIGDHVKAVVRMMSKSLLSNINAVYPSERKGHANPPECSIMNNDGVSLYLGNILSVVNASLYEEKRDTQVLNLPLLLSLLFANNFTHGILVPQEKNYNIAHGSLILPLPKNGFLLAIQTVLKNSLLDVKNRARDYRGTPTHGDKTFVKQNGRQLVSRYVAASFPTALSLLRRLIKRSLIINSHLNTTLSKAKNPDLMEMFSDGVSKLTDVEYHFSYSSTRFARALHGTISPLIEDLWNDENLPLLPAYLMNPVVCMVNELVTCLDESSKQNAVEGSDSHLSSNRSSSRESDITDLQQRLSRNLSAMNVILGGSARSTRILSMRTDSESRANSSTAESSQFEPREETINQLTDMGFSREHGIEAIQSTGSNRLEIAMEYALSHPPPSPRTIERRSQRQRYLESTSNAQPPPPQLDGTTGTDTTSANMEDTTNEAPNSNRQQNADSAVDSLMELENEGQQSQNPSNLLSAASVQSAKQELSEEEKKKTQEQAADMYLMCSSKLCLKSIQSALIPVSLKIIERNGSLTSDDSDNTNSLHYSKEKGKENEQSSNKCTNYNARNSESEATTIVVCSFLLDMCERYPKERSNIITQLLSMLKSKLIPDKKCSHCKVMQGKEAQFASLCHASVILLRALPRTRVIVLRQNLVSCLLQCTRSCISKMKSSENNGKNSWPSWLAPSLLLIDIMAQPTSISLKESDKDELESCNSIGIPTSNKGEFARVCSEHRRQTAILAKTADRISSAMNEHSTNEVSKQKSSNGKENRKKKNSNQQDKKSEKKSMDIDSTNEIGNNVTQTKEGKAESTSVMPAFPAFLPLVTQNTAEFCMNVCLQLLRFNTIKSNAETEENRYPSLPSEVIQATLILFTRVLRLHKISSQCLKLGGAELLLKQSPKSRFKGHSGLITVALRRMLEDESTLQTAMETEIRSTVTKLHKKQSRSSDNSRPKINSRAFIQAITPLICRDPVVFLMAASCSVRVEAPATSVVGRQSKIILLTTEERSKNIRAISECVKQGCSLTASTNLNANNHNSLTSTKQNQKISSPGAVAKRGRLTHKSKSPHSKNSKNKSPHRLSLSKKGMSPRKSLRREKFITIYGTPSNHLISLLLNELMKEFERDDEQNIKKRMQHPYLSVADYLEIIADLVLAVPACAAAIHRFHPSSYKDYDSDSHPLKKISHALFGFSSPPKNAVSYLLHNILPQPRLLSQNTSKNDNSKKSDFDSDISEQKRKRDYTKIKVSQSTARLLVALVARAGEGRRRVITDLALALGGSSQWNLKQDPKKSENSFIRNDDKEMWALQSWGELCFGLAAPRSSSINQDSNSSLSFEVVRVMLECGMAHALMHGIKKVRLHHPLAATTAAALLRPLEVFTRSSVIDAVQEMAEKELEQAKNCVSESIGKSRGNKKNDITSGLNRRTTLGPSQRSENAFADDAMLEDGFDAHTAERSARRSARRHARQQDLETDMIEIAGDNNVYEEVVDDTDSSEDVDDEFSEDDEMDENTSVSEAEEDEVDEIEVRLGHPDDTDDDDDDDDDDDEEEEEGDDGDSVSDEEISSDDETLDSDSSGTSASDNDMDENMEDTEVVEDTIMANDGNEDDNDESFDWDGEGGDDFLEDLVEYDDEDPQDSPIFAMPDEDPQDPSSWTAPDEDGWTRIEQPGIGQMLVGVRSANAASGRPGRRGGGFIVEAAEAMIGNILRTGDIRTDTLSEIEDALGIRIMHHSRPDSNQRTSRSAASVDVSTTNEDNTSNNITDEVFSSWNRGPVGTVPSVHQINPPDSGFSSISTSGGRVGELNSMDYVYGRHAIGSGSIYYDLSASPEVEDETNQIDNLQVPSNVDTQLFPGGPAASTHSRTHQSLHPLLSGVDLPPMNALRSTNRPHNSQSSRSSRSDTELGWTSILANSRGIVNILNRGPSQSAVDRARANGSLFAWTDDGQPLDSTVGDFTLAFEQVLGDAITQDATSRVVPGDNAVASLQSNNETRHSERNESTVGATNQNDSTENMATESVVRDAEEETTPRSEVTSRTVDNSSNASVGDAVASSLATGLTFSSANDLLSLPEQMQSSQRSNINHAAETGANSQGQSNETEAPILETVNASNSQSQNDSLVDARHLDSRIAASATNNSANEINSSSTREETAQENVTVNSNGLVCPPGMDLEVFNSLPHEMQQEIVQQHQETINVAAQLDASSGIDLETLAELPEEIRREVIQQEQQERRLRDQAPADPSNAEEMDNASFIVSLAPELREEVLLQVEDSVLNTLPPDIVAEVQLLRERAASNHRRSNNVIAPAPAPAANNAVETRYRPTVNVTNPSEENQVHGHVSGRRRSKTGKMRTDCNRSSIIYMSPVIKNEYGALMTSNALKALIRLTFLLSPVRPQRLLQKLIQNICANADIRQSFLTSSVALLNDDPKSALMAVDLLDRLNESSIADRFYVEFNEFPPRNLIGTAPEIVENDAMTSVTSMFRRRNGGSAAASIAANLPASSRGSPNDKCLPPVVARRLIGIISFLSKNYARVSLDMLRNFEISEAHNIDSNRQVQVEGYITCLDKLLDLLGKPLYVKSPTNLEELLNMIESVVTPLSQIPKDNCPENLSKKDIDSAAAVGKEYVDVPRTIVSQKRLQLLCSILRLESCKDACFAKVNNIAQRLCRVEINRSCILRELALVAQGLGIDAIRDLRSLNIRLNEALQLHQDQLKTKSTFEGTINNDSASLPDSPKNLLSGTPSSAVTLSTSSSELKLLRVLRTLHSLCGVNTDDNKKREGAVVSQELVSLLQSIDLESLWEQLNACLRIVSVLEGVSHIDEIEDKKFDANEIEMIDNFNDENNDNDDTNLNKRKKLQNNVAGLLTRFLPTIEAFFVVNASSTGDNNLAKTKKASIAESTFNRKNNISREESLDLDKLVDGRRFIEFVANNKVLLNALLRSNPSLLDKGLRAIVQVPRSRPFLDFDVKRQWFKTQVRRLRQQASRRHGSLRLLIRRDHVFEDAFRQLRLRNADEIRGRLHITFRNEEGVDAGGLSREFFAILAKEMFNPNYALFTSTEDGCTFQPNPQSNINPEHLSYFQFVGRIVGKAVVDGFLLDAHFTRSLYKHMLGMKPTHHDMQAIDPDYYKNLKMILEYNLGDIGLDLTFSTEAHSFGRSQTIDLIKDGRNIKVTEQNKDEYVSLVCQHRMTISIEKQIDAFLKGFHELVKPELISIFTPKELELLISGMPDIDIDDLKKNTDYQGYKVSDKEIGWFWNIMFTLSRSEKAAFLQFVTGSSKVPLTGFAELQGMRGIQKFSIHKAGGSAGALMSAHTCFNALDLPVYKSEDEMKQKLLYAIQEGQGGFLFA